MSSYTGKDIKTLTPIEGIRQRASMYIGSTDIKGLHHLAIEIINNSVDEALNGFGTTITVEVDSKANAMRVIDEGRGMPFDATETADNALIEAATSTHSGGKFSNGEGAYATSGGLNGVGLTVTNALSSQTIITSIRDGQTCSARFSRGELFESEIKDVAVNDTGTTVMFKPDSEIFGAAKFEYHRLREFIREMSFLVSGVKFIFNFDGEKETFLSTDGIIEKVREDVEDLTCITPVRYIKGTVDGYVVEAAFAFTAESSEKITSYVNLIQTTQGGTHVTGMRTSLTASINKLIKQFKFFEEGESNLKGDLIRKGLVMTLSVKMNKTPEFKSQTKDALNTAEARGKVSNVFTTQLPNVMEYTDIKAIYEKAMKQIKAEKAYKRAMAAEKAITQGSRKAKMIGGLPAKLADANGKGYKELFITEGDSASTTLKAVRNPATQAVLPLKGKVLNTFSRELADIVQNKEIKDILITLGAGAGSAASLRNLRYDKIIIAVDADDDGHHIFVLLMTLLLVHITPVVEAGRVYKAVTPLYGVKKGKNTMYFYSDEELEYYIQKNGEPKKIERFKGLGAHSKPEIKDVLANEDSRQLIQLTTEDIEKTLKVYDTMMGTNLSARKKLIRDGGA